MRRFYSIPSTLSFSDYLAKFVDNLAIQKNHNLSDIKIYLPTRRAIQTLKDGFLRQSNGQPRILPQLLAIADGDDDALSFSLQNNVDVLPPISTMQRQIVLARLLEKAWSGEYN
jgi:ATP-dependent helicase/nuclease subunit B